MRENVFRVHGSTIKLVDRQAARGDGKMGKEMVVVEGKLWGVGEGKREREEEEEEEEEGGRGGGVREVETEQKRHNKRRKGKALNCGRFKPWFGIPFINHRQVRVARPGPSVAEELVGERGGGGGGVGVEGEEEGGSRCPPPFFTPSPPFPTPSSLLLLQGHNWCLQYHVRTNSCGRHGTPC